ncbi:MAG: DNA mismatch repair endonuclease MutL [Selenomonadaceae bacterium]|nr:DNA mismatch repair endonuclease MutL [Selenomonadaceae bacterium]
MNNVKLLDKSTINKIAAGEVVERPASCVKELIENAIDAKATRIEIEIQNGGKAMIRVTDNGIGMNRADALLAVLRHATSKLSTADDLQRISTLGFRGEALPTIAAVSKFTIQTRRADYELGTLIKIEGGKITDTHEIGCQTGTTVIVSDLFFNTPARLKFLKATPTEANKIHEYIVKLAISRPDIAFRFINGNRMALVTPGNGKLIDTIAAIYGTELSDSLLTLKDDSPELKITGYVTKPNILKSYRSWQTFVINGRIVENRTISKAVDEAYKSLIPKTGFPLAVMIMTVPQNSIDVNVHPQKTEIKFEDEGKIFKAVYHTVRDAVEGNNLNDGHDLTKVAAAPDSVHFEQITLSDDFDKEPPPVEKVPEIKNNPRDNFDLEQAIKTVAESKKESAQIEMTIKDEEPPMINIPPPVEKSSPVDKNPTVDKKSTADKKSATDKKSTADKNPVADKKSVDNVPPVKDKPSAKNPVLEFEPIGQVANCYIVAQSGNDLYIIDQHAAHERILFDRLSGYAERIPAQGLLIHRIMKFDAKESELIEKNLEVFSALGFTLEPSGVNEFRLTEVPLDASGADEESLLRGILTEIFTGVNEPEDIAKKIRHAVLATTACKAAIKAGQELNTRQMQILLKDLSQTPHPHTCPHGRPTIVKFSSSDLAKMFKRT